MAINWTPSQTAAITTRGHDILVSAAAGSGKTAALTERIIQSLTREDNPTDITRILAVTFTRAAAAELRRRISGALSQRISESPGNKLLLRQLMLLGSAKICTIDAFCSDVVKAGFSQLPLPAGFRIPDKTELKLLCQSVMEDVIDAAFENGGTDFAALADSLASSNKNDKKLWELLYGTYNRLLDLPEGIEYLRHSYRALEDETKERFYDTRAGRACAGEIISKLDYFINILELATGELADNEKTSKQYLPAFVHCLEHCRALKSAVAAGDYTAARGIALDYAPVALKNLGKEYKTPRTQMWADVRKEIIDSLRDTKSNKTSIQSRFFALSEDEIRNCFERTATMCRTMYSVLSEFQCRMNEEKQARGLCDFNDLRRYAYMLLVSPDGSPTPLARDYAARFDEIFIDEYQDVTEVQDCLFRAISNGHNRFMVGDIKQSIYGFRGAEPSLFAAYRTDFGREDSCGETIFMSENFRCDKPVIDFVNLMCSRLFPACGVSIGYTSEDDLVQGKPTPPDVTPARVSVAVITAAENHNDTANDLSPDSTAAAHITSTGNAPLSTDPSAPPDSDEEPDSPEDKEQQTEACYVASRISDLLSSGRRNDGAPLSPGDIAALCRTKSVCAAMTVQLEKLGIPVNSDSSSGYYTRPEVSLMISLLTVIDNPQKDIPTAAVLRSPLFGFTMDDLSLIRKKSDKKVSLYDAVTAYCNESGSLAQKCRAFATRLEGYRGMARSLSADRLLRGLYRDTSILSLCTEPSARAGLERLYEYARQFEAGSFRGLYNFIKYLNQAIAQGDEGESPAAEPGADAVTVLTMHHSKGLEFPVCFVCGCGGKFNFKDTEREFIFSRKLGPGIRLKDMTGLASLRTPLYTAAALDSIRLQTEEEMRLFYVAMTRAREQLIITASCQTGFDKKLQRAELCRETGHTYPLLHAKCSLDWMLSVLSLTPPANACYRFDLVPKNTIPTPIPYVPGCQISSADAVSDRNEDGLEQKYEHEFERRFSYVYPYEHLSRLPAKLSVSKLYPGMLDENETTDYVPESFSPKLGTMTFAPRFLTQDAANKVDLASGTPDSSDFSDEKNRSAHSKRGEQFYITPAERGTATHVFLQFCDFDYCVAHGVAAELERLMENGFIPASMASIVNIEQLEAFFSSELFAGLQAAREIHREQRFNIMLPASAFSDDASTSAALSGERILVQGVIDLFFTSADGRLVLCDYKTDRLSAAQLADPELARSMLSERHRTQLSYYAAALSRICARRPDSVIIYSLPLGRALEIETDKI